MQTGLWIVLAACVVGMLAATLETTWVKTAQVCMALCGFLLILSTSDPGMRHAIARVWSNEVAHYVLYALRWGGGIVLAVSLYWTVKELWDDHRQRRDK